MVSDDRDIHGYTEECMPDSERERLQGPDLCSSEEEYVVRRLTPTECARLQGFPDDWCADVPHSDSAEYKLWGNGIALPCVIPMMQRMAAVLKKDWLDSLLEDV